MEAGVRLPLNMKYYEFLSIYQYLKDNFCIPVNTMYFSYNSFLNWIRILLLLSLSMSVQLKMLRQCR